VDIQILSKQMSSVDLGAALVALRVVDLGILSVADEPKNEVPDGQSEHSHDKDASVEGHDSEHEHIGKEDADEVDEGYDKADLARQGVN
jgi:hypothetical protein